MKRLAALAAAGLMAVAATPASTEVDADQVVELGLGDSVSVEGTKQGGINPSPFLGDAVCSDSPGETCETIFVAATNEVPEGQTIASGVIGLSLSAQVPGSDFDLFVYESDETGAKGAEVASSGDAPAGQLIGDQDPTDLYGCREAADECVQFVVDTFDDEPTRYFLVEIVYFATPASFTLDASFS